MAKVWKHSLDHSDGNRRTVNLSQASLGKFTYWATKLGAEITQIWSLNDKYERSWVGVVVKIDEDRVAEFEEKSGFGLKDPPKVNI